MPSYKIPIAIWEDFGGTFTAVTVDGDLAEATGVSAKSVQEQIKQYLSWLYREEWPNAPVMRDPQLMFVRTNIRGEYHTEDENVYPAEERMEISIPCVWSQCRDSSFACRLPTLNIDFHCYEKKSIESMAEDFAQRSLLRLDPSQLNRHLLPKSIRLDSVNVRAPNQLKSSTVNFVATLELVADPLGSRLLRRNITSAWSRETEVADLVQRLGDQRSSLLLVGEHGVGKTTIIADAVRTVERQLQEKEGAKETARYRFWFTSGARLIAGMQYLGQWEARCEKIIDELAEIQGVLCIENLRELLQAGGDSPANSVAAFLAPYLERGELRIVGETTPAELEAIRRLMPGFDVLFQIVRIEEFDDVGAHQVLNRLADTTRQQSKINVTPVALDTLYRLFRRFLPYDKFPGKCTAFVDELCRRTRLELNSKTQVLDSDREIDAERIVTAFTQRTGLPEWILRDELPLDPSQTKEWFEKRIIGQTGACQSATDLIATFKSGLNDPNRPIGVQIYCGPTGVGKTQLAKSLSTYLFGAGEAADERLVRIDMSEYASFGSAERLLSRPDGQPSELIERVRAQPFVVVLFDEIEKAAAEVFDVMLGLFDEGRLTDRYGRVTSFRSSVILLTSNLGSDSVRRVGFGGEAANSFENAVKQFFRPELFNRLDDVVTFSPLGRDSVRRIAQKELTDLLGREGLTRRQLRLHWTDAVVEHVSRLGFDERYGARPLQRAVEQAVVAPVSHYIAENPEERSTSLWLDVVRSQVVVRRGP